MRKWLAELILGESIPPKENTKMLYKMLHWYKYNNAMLETNLKLTKAQLAVAIKSSRLTYSQAKENARKDFLEAASAYQNDNISLNMYVFRPISITRALTHNGASSTNFVNDQGSIISFPVSEEKHLELLKEFNEYKIWGESVCNLALNKST